MEERPGHEEDLAHAGGEEVEAVAGEVEGRLWGLGGEGVGVGLGGRFLALHEAEVAPHEELDEIGCSEKGVAVVGGDGRRERLAVVVQGPVQQRVLGAVVLRVARVEVVEVGGGEGEHGVDQIGVLMGLGREGV